MQWLLGAYRSYLVYRLEYMKEMSFDNREEREGCEESRSRWFAGPMGICWWGENPSQRFQMGQSAQDISIAAQDLQPIKKAARPITW